MTGCALGAPMTTQRAGAGEHELSGGAYRLGVKEKRLGQRPLRVATGRAVDRGKVAKECICDIYSAAVV